MDKFIELIQKTDRGKRTISVNVSHIDFFYDNHVVFGNRAIDVFETYEEIKQKINE